MRKIAVFITTCFFLSSLLFAQNTGIIPTPQSVSYQSGTFIWDDNIVLDFDSEIQDKTLILQEYETLRGTKAVTSEMTKKATNGELFALCWCSTCPLHTMQTKVIPLK